MLDWSLSITARLWNKTNYLWNRRPEIPKKGKCCVQVLLVLCCPILVSKWLANIRKYQKITVQFARQNIGYLYIKLLISFYFAEHWKLLCSFDTLIDRHSFSPYRQKLWKTKNQDHSLHFFHVILHGAVTSCKLKNDIVGSTRDSGRQYFNGILLVTN